MSATATKTLEVGDAAPDFALEDTAGKPWTLSKLLKDRPVLLLSIRGTW